MKNLIRHILIESAKEKFINTVVSKLKPPYFKNLKKLAADDQEIEIIFKMIFGEGVTVVNDLSNGDYKILDDNGNLIYFEDSDGYWAKKQYDGRDNQIYREDSDGDWQKWEYDEMGNLIYHETSGGYWVKWEYDEMGNLIYHETSIRGVIVDKR